MKKKSRSFYVILYLMATIGGPAYGQDTSSVFPESLQGLEKGTYRFEFDNDILFGKDSGLTSGWSLQKHTPIAESWSKLEGAPGFIGRWGARIPTLTADGLFKRAGIAIGQVMQTSTDLSRSDLIEDDVPYAGALTVQATWYAFNDDQFRGFQTTVGVVGPASLAEQTQKFVHNLIDSDDPKGWDNQLSNEPVINFNYMYKRKLWRTGSPPSLSFDTSACGNVVLGNMFTQALASLEMRFGHNMPSGFVYVIDPIGYSMQYDAALAPANPAKASYYGSLVLRGVAVAHNIFLDGNTFKDSHSVPKEPLVGQLILGLHYERPTWSVHSNIVYTTDTVDTSQVTAAEGNEMFGNVIIEWRI
ncbi:MAG: lipid A deacylase LpxR family protein [Pseudomonadota bacterium]|nr:lipid A deacylase LpxR family protein [Pseudomonadota bacterium]